MTHDAKQILLAIMQAAAGPYPGEDYDYLIELDGVQHKLIRDVSVHPRPYMTCWVWEQRHGKPWQAAVEEVVRRYLECQTYATGL